MAKRGTHEILVVDDDPDLREGLAYLIRHWGHAVVTAANGREALDRLDLMAGPPCMIILDLTMPVMDGWELRRSLLKRPAFADVPVLLVSGIADLDEAAETLSPAAYLRKPVDVNELSRLVDAQS
ncbi:MAG: response regulator [Woeseia sp.]